MVVNGRELKVSLMLQTTGIARRMFGMGREKMYPCIAGVM